MEYRIPRDTTSNNKIIWWKSHLYWAYLNEKDDWAKWCLVLRSKFGVFTKDKKRIVCIIRYCHKFYDDDNFKGGLKPFLDMMKKQKLIQDDNPKRIELIATQIKTREDSNFVEVSIVDEEIVRQLKEGE